MKITDLKNGSYINSIFVRQNNCKKQINDVHRDQQQEVSKKNNRYWFMQQKEIETNSEISSEEKKIELINRFLSATVGGGKRTDMDADKLYQVFRIFQADAFNETVENIVGLYDPSSMHCLNDRISGILFMKNRFIYIKDFDQVSTAVEYTNIKCVIQNFNSMTVYLHTGKEVKLKGLMFSTDELYAILNELKEIK